MSIQEIYSFEANNSEISSSLIINNASDQKEYILPAIKEFTLGSILAIGILLRFFVRTNDENKNIFSETIKSAINYYKTLYYFLVTRGSLEDCPYFKENTQAQCHLYSLES